MAPVVQICIAGCQEFHYKKVKNMRISENKYASFGRLITEDRIYIDTSADFSRICRWLGICEKALDDLLRDELGCGGEELLAACRDMYRAELSEKYGIKVSALL